MEAIDIPTAEAKIKASGITLSEFFRRAEINATTWLRWRQEKTEPNTRTLRRVRAELDRLPAQQAAQ